MFTNNRKAKRLRDKSSDERDALIDVAKRATPKFREDFKAPQPAIQDYCMEQLKEKEAGIAHRLEQPQKKETLTAEITGVDGFWISKEVVKEQLSKLPCVANKRLALNLSCTFASSFCCRRLQLPSLHFRQVESSYQ